MRDYLKILTAAILAALLATTAANPAMWQWSKTASSNANADPTINWAEGMSPSSVNDSARAMMAATAAYRDDISGALTTGGTATAYTITSNQGIASVPTDGQMIAFTPHATNGISPNMTVDGGTTYALQSAPGVAIGAGTLVLGSPYRAKFSLSNTAWILEAFYGNPYAVPLGGLLSYTGATAPNSNFVLAFGQCVSRTTYATYFSQVGTAFGTCDGTTTFGVPDLRGRAPWGLDNIGGSAANRMTSAATGCGVAFTSIGVACGSESHTLTTAELASHTHTASVTDPGHTHPINNSSAQPQAGANFLLGGTGGSVTGSATTGITVSNANAGGGGAHSIVPPALGLNYILRII